MPSAAAMAGLAGAAAGLGMLALDQRVGLSKDLFQLRVGKKTQDYVAALVAEGRFSRVEDFLLSAKRKPEHPFIIFQEQPGNGQNVVVTYRQAFEASNRLARYLIDEHGAKPGDMIASLNENTPQFVLVMLAAWLIGCGVAFQNYQQAGRVFTHSINVSGANILVFEPVLQSRVADVADFFAERGTKLVCYSDPPVASRFSFPCSYVTDADLRTRYPDLAAAEIPREMRKGIEWGSVAELVYTSGTTGLPKAATQSHGRLSTLIGMHYMDIFRETDRMYAVGPLFHSNGGIVLHLSYMLGTTLCITRRFSASNFFAFCAQTGVNSFPYVGEFIRFLCLSPPSKYDRAHQVRVCTGNGVRPDIWTAFQDRFGVRVIELFGASEGNVSMFNFWNKPGAVGFQGPLMRWINKAAYPRLIRIDPNTEQIVRDPKTGFCIECKPGEPGECVGRLINDNFLGYYKNEEATNKKFLRDAFEPNDIWVRTGDLLMRDNDNFFWFVDRLGDTFRWKGENVSTMEVRDVILSCPVVQDCNVYGVTVPGREDGRAGMAALILKPEERSRRDEAMVELGKYCGKELPAYAVPRFMRIFETFEATSTVTFKYTKAQAQKEGFDPTTLSEPLYFYEEGTGYVPLTANLYRTIIAGKAKL
ncbi:hypothetical protein DFJ74DRAFT_683820 [Hyaloraphidium curvatum]|nr:hypothetical protein DFJ74DRAFT_683820 [Hyaloraphidium curvatum]